ncbi:Uncharacterised protein [Yersinia intermedia]|uniref:Uncharacterized protein n=1 Tax=Yersinia intermedia TaxID=631 RepID=A0A0H5LT56_YERIN|nr:hypothetical protein [Yersinia intermedia]CRY54082.1 Uncharacterised protein [Yersinia intermedia]
MIKLEQTIIAFFTGIFGGGHRGVQGAADCARQGQRQAATFLLDTVGLAT